MEKRRQKKILSVMLAFATMLASIEPVHMVRAAEKPSVIVTTDKESVSKGEQLNVTVSLKGELAAASGQVAFKYDENKLEVLRHIDEKGKDVANVEYGEALLQEGVFLKAVNADKAGKVFGSFLCDLDETVSAGDLFTVEFKVKENASGKIKFDFIEEEIEFNNELSDGNEEIESIPVDAIGKEISISNPLQSIALNKTSLSLNKGAKEQLTVTYNPEDTTDDKKVTWISKDEKVATVSADGTVTATGKGTTTITAKVGEKTAVCNVTVSNPITKITLPEAVSLKKGQTETLKVTYEPEDADAGTIAWSSDNEAVASVNKNGVVTAKADGTATISAKVNGLTATCKVTVKEIKLESISLNKTEMTIARNANEKLTVSYNPENTTDDKSVKWTVSDDKILSVDGDGVVTGKAVGKAIVTAQVGTKTAQCEVTVNAPLEKIAFAKQELALLKGQSSDELKTVTYFPADTTDEKNLTWESDNTSVAAVDENGTVTARKAGTANIKATGANGTTAVCKVTVTEISIEGVVLNRTDAIVEAGETLQLTASVYPENTTDTDKTIKWASKDSAIATVDENGLVTAVKGGKTVITATAANGTKAECSILVPIHMTGLEIQKPASAEVLKGKTMSLSAKAVPADTTDSYNVTWSSSDNSIATVDKDGMVTGIKEGKVTITATSGTFQDSMEVTVKEIHMTGFELSYNKENLENGKLLKGQSLKIDVTYLPENTTDDRTVTWSVSDDDIVSIDPNGIVTALKAGKATITAKVGTFEKSIKLEIAEIPLKSIAFDKVISSMVEGEKAVLAVIYNPENTTDAKDVVWSSSDSNVISVENGQLTAKKAGKAVITAKVGTKRVSCEITVKAKENGTGNNNNNNSNNNANNGNKVPQNNNGNTTGNKVPQNNNGNKKPAATGDNTVPVMPISCLAVSMMAIVMILKSRKITK